MFINQSISTSQSQLADINASLKEQKLEETQKRVTDISDSIKLALQVLSREILFSKLISQVGAAMPSGASLQSLSIGSTEGGIDLTAGADDYQTATQVQVNLADKDNKIFEKADIVNITCVQPANTGATATGPEPYPCTISIRALFSKDNGFQYITAAGLKK